MHTPDIVIAGGGAAGYFAAIAAAEKNPRANITLLEAGLTTLTKVRISGGGRCNLTNAIANPTELAKNYPRGGRELIGPLHRWGTRDTAAWFTAHGIPLHTQADGRIFPQSDHAMDIVNCLRQTADTHGIRLRLKSPLRQVAANADGTFTLTLADATTLACDRLLIATGGGADNAGHSIARQLGHTIEEPVPALFTFHIDDPRLAKLEGLSVPDARVRAELDKPPRGTRLEESGALLITHWGLSGPAILKLSSWAARALADCDYKFQITLNWNAAHTPESAFNELTKTRAQNPKKHISTFNPLNLPSRLWENLLAAENTNPATPWTNLSNATLQQLARQAASAKFTVSGKSANKEEFVTCGGVKLSEIDFKTMQSRIRKNLFFAGEVLDIDALTGGFNFQAAWTTGRIAGETMANTGTP